MQDICFTASEYQADQSIRQVDYCFHGAKEYGWTVKRNNEIYLELGPGYVPVRTRACGICSTDLARHQLPFPLPQISGHELIGEYQQHKVAIEINASHQARAVNDTDCIYCQNNLDIHCPERMTLGIDRLPGGFSPWVLAPINAIHMLPEIISDYGGTLIEPFAAALKAITVSTPQDGDKIAVLGPRRLGMLIIAALNAFRQLHGLSFEIVAVMRHAHLQAIAKTLGADTSLIIKPDRQSELGEAFDIVFDTTGSVDGLALAATMAKRTLHLKSTHGQTVMGLENITSMVINEQALLGLNRKNLHDLMEKSLGRSGKIPVYVSPHIATKHYAAVLNDDYTTNSEIPMEFDNKGLFDMALVSSVDEINRLTRPHTIQGQSLLRAGGGLLLDAQAFENQSADLLRHVSQGSLELATSRCGHFAEAINLFQQQPELIKKLEQYLVSEIKPLSELAEAFQLAGKSDKSIKLVIDTRQT